MANEYSTMWYELFLEPIRPEQTALEVAFLTRQLPNPPYGRLLDLCCGQGRHAELLAAQGYQVTGVDLNQHALDKARSLSGNQVTYLEWDMRRLATMPGSFDVVVCLWQSFGYFDAATNADILRQISRKLNRPGRLVLDLYHRGFFERHQGTRVFERDKRRITSTQQMIGDRLRVELRYGREDGDIFEWQLFTPESICTLAAEHDFAPLLLCTSFDENTPASEEQARMQIVFEVT